jgi:putrescine transport system substrate-binding protein
MQNLKRVPSMKLLAKSIVGAAIIASCTGVAAADKKVVRIYNWSDYIAEDTVDKFQTATSISVTYDVYDSNEVLEAKVLAGQSGYDVVVPTTDYLARHIQAGAYQKLDRSKIPNWKNLDKDLLENIAVYDPDNAYGVPYQWGTNGVGYNVAKVTAALGEDAPTDSWSLIFDPKVSAKLKGCGIGILDSGREIMPLALRYLGLDPNSEKADDYKKAQALLLSVRDNITYFHSSRYITDLANGDICVAIGYSGDVFQAAARAEEAENGVEVAYYIPKEGTAMWSDMMAIPKDAKNIEEAYAWINFVLDPKIGADITNYVWYGSPNAASKEFIDPEILSDPGIYPVAGTQLFTLKTLSPKTMRVLNRSWTKVKSGK